MTESEWENCTDPLRMLTFLRGRISDRKLRLFACACCRKRWKWLTDVRSQKAVILAEKFADGLAKERDLRNAFQKAAIPSDRAERWWQDAVRQKKASWPRSPTVQSCIDRARLAYQTAYAARWAAYPFPSTTESYLVGCPKNHQETCPSLRHIIGNPFRPRSAAERWSMTVVHLAGAMYQGQDCGFALHDALLEEDHGELAEHFRRERWHPKGCWVLDLLLGKN